MLCDHFGDLFFLAQNSPKYCTQSSLYERNVIIMKCGVWNHIFIKVLFIHKTLPWLFSCTFRSLFVNYCMPKTLPVPLAKQEIKETFCVLDNCISRATLTCVCSNTQLLGFSHNSGFIVQGSAWSEQNECHQGSG